MPLVTEELDGLVQSMTEEEVEQRISLKEVLSTCKLRTSGMDVEREVRKLATYVMGEDDSPVCVRVYVYMCVYVYVRVMYVYFCVPICVCVCVCVYSMCVYVKGKGYVL